MVVVKVTPAAVDHTTPRGGDVADALTYGNILCVKYAGPNAVSSPLLKSCTTASRMTAMSPLSGLVHCNPYVATITKGSTAATTASKSV